MPRHFLEQTFARFVRNHDLGRHFRRHAVLETLSGSAVDKHLAPLQEEQLNAAAQMAVPALLQSLGSSSAGLSEAAAAAVRAVSGLNVIDQQKTLPWWWHLWACYRNPFNLLLTVLATISYLTDDFKACSVILAMVLLSTVMRYVQETRSSKAADQLKALVSNTATVLRPAASAGAAAQRLEVALKFLVPGDVVQLSAGDMIPADVRVLTAKDLFLSQAAMTGESLPVEKFAEAAVAATPLESATLCFMGTNVVSGAATAVVLAIGSHTYFGTLADRVMTSGRGPTAFQTGVNQVSWVLIRFMLVMTPLVFFINGFTKGDWLEAFLFALSIAVGLTPEMLPVIVTSTLAKGAVILSRKKVIVKRLDAIQNFGAMDILCTDKTGTLTQDKVSLTRHLDAYGQPSQVVFEYAYLNSYYQTGLKNLLDVAVLEHVDAPLGARLAAACHKIDEVPFDFSRRRMSVVVSQASGEHLLVCKGAVEEILGCCSAVQDGEQVAALTPAVLAQLQAVSAQLNAEGLRVVAVARRQFAVTQATYGVADESDLVLLGYLAFLDPPKESTAPALKALRANGITVKILTGDNALVTAKICREVGLEVEGMQLGSDIAGLSDAELLPLAQATTVFAKLSPLDKERIVRVLHEHGHVVGFMGDGINDAAALHAADIGISVDTAVDIAKEAADIILLEKSLMVLDEGVIEGRKTFANMLKYIKMTASSNFGNVFSVLIASAFLPFLPMLPVQLLVQNLFYDISQVAIPFDHVDAEFLRQPQRWNPADLGRFMVFFGPVSSLFDLLTFALLWYVFHINTLDQQALFQSAWFVEGLLSQTLIVHLIRTRKIPFIQSRAAWPLIGMTAAVMVCGLALPFSALAGYFKFVALPAGYLPWLLALLFCYMLLTQAMKHWYARRYRWQ
ncbi:MULTISPECIES: magnesium-translocating P-type ATPase [unclassified Undibacterium]|uniref:magnesium-translocating P-type ATPase n=1 Tax=unclassified Undibacterium TaxID=2630295 RepID=UPI002AC948B4|nr:MULTISPECIES: magnesium-translocating P-type ATPase [unclassified Undibacterium]MEB0138799.1 magnesium-translocating P-type ATPase [Undibacterium sp. CCC2.1]MEB0170725.1 magnesium-translocating P-type ATPase [Undibacterium sp. CCC1.1]MEB0174614.1 magnesium-translocating P-type ATPase [Undibacterium sp. CCC3.4]MEB0213811.1 magnesium-translocating P-type ATPase [Undibacterium sp. 5I2]WPX42538.1 magnesium-translocating P-type ATPase [Undibacterium sp. CCC3.4]